MLMLGVWLAGFIDGSIWYWLVFMGGLVSLTCGMPPAIEVSGTPVLRGGGGGARCSGPKVYG